MSNILTRALALLAGLLLLSAPALNAQGPTAAKIRGDVDGDGRVTEADAQAVRAHLVGRPLPQGATILPAGDANGDGRITAVDAAVISRFVAGGDVSRFPVGKPEPGSETAGTGGGGTNTAGDLFVAQLCEVDVVAGTVSCAAPAPQTGGARPDLVLGNPGVSLVSGGPATVHKLQAANEDTTMVPVRVRNNIGQTIGTSDGTTLDPDGVRVFFNNGPYVTQVVGGGPIGGATVRMENVDGTATFTPPSGTPVYTNKPYYQYDEMLAQNVTSASQTWLFVYSQNVTRFAYFVFISAPVRFEYGWINVTPPSSVLDVAGTTTLSAAVFNEFGASVGDGVTWSSSNDAVATVNPSTGLVTGVTPGTVTITATSTVEPLRTGTATVIVDAAPTVLSTVPVDDATGVSPAGTITINFSESVNATGTAFTLQCPDGSDHAFTASASPASSYVLTPSTPLPSATVCEVTVVAAQITDVDANDGPNNMAADYVFDFTTSNALSGDVYPQNVIGNVNVNSANIPFSVTTNDQIAPGATITFFGWEATSGVTKNGGLVTMTTSGAGIGQFTYNPPAGFEGVDSLKYQVGSSPGDTARIGIPVSGMIWFVNNNAGACVSNCNGRLTNPFTTLAALQAVNNGTGNNPAGNDWIFFYESSTAYGGPLTLLNTQKAIGQDISLSLATLTGFTVPSGSAALPPTNTGSPNRAIIGGANGIGLAVGNSLGGLSLEPAAGTALAGTGFGTLNVTEVSIAASGTGQALNLDNGTISPTSAFTSVSSSGGTIGARLNNVNGTVALGTGSIGGASNQALLINGGSATVTYGGALANTTGRTVEITSRTAGNITLSGSLTGQGTGILVNAVTGGAITFSGGSKQIFTTGTNPAVTLTNNTGATIDFSGGGLGISTDDGAGLTATGGGTLVVTGGANTLTSTGGIALDVQNTTIGGSGLDFASINANGGLHGIRLLTVGASGGLNVPGGGVIQNTTGHAVTIVSAGGSHALQSMNISGGASGNSAVFGDVFGTLNLNASTLSATGGPALNLQSGTVGGAIASLSSTTSSTNGVRLVAVDGVLTASAGSITGANNTSVAVNGGALDLVFATGVTHADADSAMVRVDGSHTGDLDFTGTMSATNGLGLQFNSAAGTYDFTGTTTLNGGGAVININNGSNGAFDFGTGTAVTAAANQTAFRAYGSSPTVTYRGNLTKTTATGSLVEVSETPGGTVTFMTGTLNSTAGSGLTFSNSDGIVNFNGTTTLSGGAQVAIVGDASGTFNFGNGVAITGGASTPFVVTSSTPAVTYSGGITQATAGQRLVNITGQASSARSIVFQTGTLSATNGDGILLSNVDGNVSFNGTTTLNGGNAGIDVEAGSTGAISFNTGAVITVANGVDALRVFNGTNSANVSMDGRLTGAGRPVLVEGVSGGTVNVTASIVGTGQGILIQNNTGGTVTFSDDSLTISSAANPAVTLSSTTGTVDFTGGNLNLTTTSGAGIVASNGALGGTLRVSGSTNVISSGTGTALSVTNTNIGSGGLNFRSISASGGANGIMLNNTGTIAGLTVSGNSTNGSGGTITNTTGGDGATGGNGIYLNTTRFVNLSWMALSGHANNGLFGTGVRGLTMNKMRFTGNNGNSNSGTFDESPVNLVNLGGAVKVTNSRFDGGAFNAFRVENTAGTAPALDSLVIDTDTVESMQGSTADVRGSAILVTLSDGTADVRIRNNRVTAWWGNGIHSLIQGTASGSSRISSNFVDNLNGALAGAGGIQVAGGNHSYNISGNTVRHTDGAAISADRVAVGANMNGTIDGNFVGVSGDNASGSKNGAGIFASHHGPGTTTHRISNNTIRQVQAHSGIGAIWLLTGDAPGFGGSGTFNATVTGNNIQENGTLIAPINAHNGILATVGTTSGPPNDTDQACLDIGGTAVGDRNTILNFNSNTNRIRVNQRFGTTSRFRGYTGAQLGVTSQTDLATYLNGRNTGTTSVNANTSTGGFLNTSPAGSACPQPSI